MIPGNNGGQATLSDLKEAILYYTRGTWSVQITSRNGYCRHTQFKLGQ